MSDSSPNTPKSYEINQNTPGYDNRVDSSGRDDLSRQARRTDNTGSGFATGAMVAVVFVVVALLAYAFYQPTGSDSNVQNGAGSEQGTVAAPEGNNTSAGSNAAANPTASDAIPEDTTTGNATPPTGVDGTTKAPTQNSGTAATPAPTDTAPAVPAEPAPAD